MTTQKRRLRWECPDCNTHFCVTTRTSRSRIMAERRVSAVFKCSFWFVTNQFFSERLRYVKSVKWRCEMNRSRNKWGQPSSAKRLPGSQGVTPVLRRTVILSLPAVGGKEAPSLCRSRAQPTALNAGVSSVRFGAKLSHNTGSLHKSHSTQRK